MTDRHASRPRKHDSRWDAGSVTADPCLSSPGWFSTRLAARAVEVPCRLWLEEDRDEEGFLVADIRYFAEVDGKPCPDPLNLPGWPWRRIDQATWQWMTDTAKWDRQHDPSSPRANPTRAATESPKQYF